MHFNFYNKILNNKKLSIFLIALLFIFPIKSNAATVSVIPSTTTVSVGNIVTVSFVVNTSGVAVNNAEASIQYPTDLLEAVSVNKSSSIFSLWVEEPKFSNSTGKITYNGGIATPGYTGASGTMAQVTFKAKKVGTASLIFTDASVRANDGLGTNVLSVKNGGTIQIGAPINVDIPVTIDNKSTTPDKPIITSQTHPNQDIWYSNNTATLTWKIPSGVNSLQTLINRDPNSTPTITYDSSVTQKTINNLNEGIYYFHLRYSNAQGWGKIAHYKINVDTVAPLPFIPEIRKEDNFNYIKLDAEDATSGIDYYTISIDDAKVLRIKKSELVNEEYKLPILNSGNHNLLVTAYDMAGNHTEYGLSFESSAISAPMIKLSTDEITKGEYVTISGTSDYPGNDVIVTLKQGDELITYTQKVKEDGSFEIVTDKLRKVGLINIWAENILADSVKSAPSEKLYLNVVEMRVVKIAIVFIWSIFILILLLLLLLIAYIGWHKYFGLKRKIEDESRQTIKDVHESMLLFKKDLDDQLLEIEKLKIDKNLNKKEEKTFAGIKHSIESIDNFIEKRLKKLM